MVEAYSYCVYVESGIPFNAEQSQYHDSVFRLIQEILTPQELHPHFPPVQLEEQQLVQEQPPMFVWSLLSMREKVVDIFGQVRTCLAELWIGEVGVERVDIDRWLYICLR